MSESEALFGVLRQSADPGCVAAIEQTVRDAPDRALCRINVLDFAAKHGLDEERALAAFLHAQGLDGRDKVTLLLPRSWLAAGLWTKQNFEESLGKSEQLGIKIVIDGKVQTVRVCVKAIRSGLVQRPVKRKPFQMPNL